MINGSSIQKWDGNSYYTPEFGRGALNATFAIDVTHLYGSPTLTVTIQHRNASDNDWTDAGAFSNITATGVATKDMSGLKEIIRLKFDFAAGDDATDGGHFFVQSPTWRP